MPEAPQPLFSTTDVAGLQEADDGFAQGDYRDAINEGAGLVLRKQQPVRTIADAVEHVQKLLDAQLARATEQNTRANVAAPGDAGARITFYTLLPDEQQRLVFLRFASQARAWPRLRTLFGAPPYGFLRAEDSGMLRAAGIATNRSNMAHEDSQAAASYTQFGAGQLTDEFAREYRVIRREKVTDTDPLPCNFEVHDRGGLLLQVRVRRRNRDIKLQMMQDETQRRMLSFPSPGERLIVKETRRMLALQGKRSDGPAKTNLVVRRVVPRGQGSSTAAVLCELR